MAALTPGQMIGGRYRLEGELARGGMGAVIRATDTRLSRSVAIKMLLPELGTETRELARFEREASAVARLSHPGIVQVLDVGREGDAPYLVMELVQGRTIVDILRTEGRLAPERAADVAEQALFAIAAANAAGIVHRDLKPGNIMVVPTGGRELVKVLDFGIAQLKTGTAYTRLTQTGAVIGTPAYMPPEQARGEPLDARADVYAMGVVLWCMLTGQRPFAGRDVADTITKVLTEVPERADRVVPGVPAMLASLCDVAMQKDPAARFPSASAFADALVALRRGASPAASSEPGAATSSGGESSTVRARPSPPAAPMAASTAAIPVPIVAMAPPSIVSPAAPVTAAPSGGWSVWRIALGLGAALSLVALVSCAVGALVLRQYAERFVSETPLLPPPAPTPGQASDVASVCDRAARCCRVISSDPATCDGIHVYELEGQTGLNACQTMIDNYVPAARAMGRSCD